MNSTRYKVCAVHSHSQDDLWVLSGMAFALFIHTLKIIYECYQVWHLRCLFTLSRWSTVWVLSGMVFALLICTLKMIYELYQVWHLHCLFPLSRWSMNSLGMALAMFIHNLNIIYEFYQVWRLRCLFTLSRWSKSIIKYCVFEFAFDIYEVWYLTWHTNFQPNHAPLAEDAIFFGGIAHFWSLPQHAVCFNPLS